MPLSAEAAAIGSMPQQIARTRALSLGGISRREAKRDPEGTATSARMPRQRHCHADRAGARSPAGSATPSEQGRSSLSRAGWSGTFEDDDARRTLQAADLRADDAITSPATSKDRRMIASPAGNTRGPVAPLEPRTPTRTDVSALEPMSPTAPAERPERRRGRPTGTNSSVTAGATGRVSQKAQDEGAGNATSSTSSAGVVKLNSTVPSSASGERHASMLSSSSSGFGRKAAAPPRAGHNPRHQLHKGSRDDSFLSTISESTSRSEESGSSLTDDHRDSRSSSSRDNGQIEVFSEATNKSGRPEAILKDFRSLFVPHYGPEDGEEMAQMLRACSFDKPLDMQRRVVPLVMSAFSNEQKSFMTIQGAPRGGKTSALVLGILGGVGPTMSGIRTVVLSTNCGGEFRKYFDMTADAHPLRLLCFEGVQRRVAFEGLPPDPESATAGVDPLEDLQRLSSALATGAPAIIYGYPTRILPLLREAPSWGVDLSSVQVLALDDAEETIKMGLMDEVCEVCTILRHFSRQHLRHIIVSPSLSHDAKSMIKCLRNSLLRQQNLFGIRAHRTQARAKQVNHYYTRAPRNRWPAMLATLHHALNLPSGIIFDDRSPEARNQARSALRAHGVTASVWNALQEQGSGARAAARDGAAVAPRGPAFHLMPSDLVVLKVDLPQVRCVLHFEVPRREMSVYGLRLMCLEHQEQKKSGRKNASGDGRSLSVLFVEEEDVVRELEKTFHIKMQELPTEMFAT